MAKSAFDPFYNQGAFFATEKIRLPRGNVVREDSLKSSPSHGFRQSMTPLSPDNIQVEFKIGARPGAISPNKIKNKYQMKIDGTDKPPRYSADVDYFKEFWRLFLQNENLLADIDQTATNNYKMARKIFNIKDFYENTLVPQILTQPHKFLHRLRQLQH